MSVDTFIGNWKDADIVERKNVLPNYKSLVLLGPGITDDGVRLLANNCQKLKELHLVDTSITDEGLKSITRIKSLDWLVLDGANVTDSGLHQLRQLNQLIGLHLVSTRVTDEAFSFMLDLPRLNYLVAADQSLQGHAMSLIGQSNSLQSLRLASNMANDWDFLRLTRSQSLRKLSFDLPLVSASAVDEVKSKLKNCVLSPFHFYKAHDKISYLSEYCIDLYCRQEYEMALKAANDLLQQFPFNAACHGTIAIINFQLGNYMHFQKDLQNLRDHAGLCGEDDLLAMAQGFLSIESRATMKTVLEAARPEDLLARRLRDTIGMKEKREPFSNLFSKSSIAQNKSSIIQVQTNNELRRLKDE